jgi:arylsulfatase A-like enzyme
MNLIWICADTFRNDYLGCMGNPTVKTPALDKLASQGALFENAYAEGLPTGPERAVFMTGKFMIPFRGWQPLIRKDTTLAEHLARKNYRTALFCDCPHFFKPNCNYHRGFDEFHWIRGQEADKFATARKGRDVWDFFPKSYFDIPLDHKKRASVGYDAIPDPLRQYLRNMAGRGADEGEFFPAKTCGAAMKWLEDNNDAEKFMLWVEMFDPHEPWDPPREYYEMYKNPSYSGANILAPWFHSMLAEDYTEEELEDIRALYAGEVTLVDRWVGHLLDKVDELGLAGNTAIVFTSDHGTMFGERNAVTKDPVYINTVSQWLCNQPLIVRHPDGPKGARIPQLVWSPDYMPTCCEMLGETPPETVHGRSFWRLAAEGDASAARDHVISGYRGNGYFYVVDEQWRYVAASDMGGEELYERATDPEEQNNVAAAHPDVCAMMRGRIQEHLDLANTLEM